MKTFLLIVLLVALSLYLVRLFMGNTMIRISENPHGVGFACGSGGGFTTSGTTCEYMALDSLEIKKWTKLLNRVPQADELDCPLLKSAEEFNAKKN